MVNLDIDPSFGDDERRARVLQGDVVVYTRKDTRVHPAPVRPIRPDEPRLCVVPPVGGIMIFSGDHLHATITNTNGATRYRVDFRTVHQADVIGRVGAPVVDVACTGTSLRDFRRITDGTAFDEEATAATTPRAPKGSRSMSRAEPATWDEPVPVPSPRMGRAR